MLNEFNTAIAAEGLKSISEGCKQIAEVCSSEYKKGNVEDAQIILSYLSTVAGTAKILGDLLAEKGAKIDTKAGDVDGDPADEKSYFWQDLSGRGAHNEFTTNELLSSFEPYEGYNVNKSDDDNDDEDISGDYLSDDGETVARWLSGLPSIGDVWKNQANRITRTK